MGGVWRYASYVSVNNEHISHVFLPNPFVSSSRSVQGIPNQHMNWDFVLWFNLEPSDAYHWTTFAALSAWCPPSVPSPTTKFTSSLAVGPELDKLPPSPFSNVESPWEQNHIFFDKKCKQISLLFSENTMLASIHRYRSEYVHTLFHRPSSSGPSNTKWKPLRLRPTSWDSRCGGVMWFS